ncbi:39S ribosomal protein L32, mitochondrial-like, partial [Pollicipes pollicipes]|uniref:39S ribosomal protein L32, mitochondrial-like n=1 Tax=Pollicipes pollicipes TaxID=41117 RepID=UPI001885101D
AWRPPVLPPAEADDGLLWAVPKHRRTVERRTTRRFGAENWPNGRKLIQPKRGLLLCFKCGGHHLPGMLCMTCYSRVMEETREMQRAVAADQGLQPPDREVAVVYRGERETVDEQRAQVRHRRLRLVELPKERPQWFSKNLSQKVTPPPVETAAVKPSDLG